MKKVIRIDKNIVFLAIKIFVVFLLLAITLLSSFACNIKVTIITIDSLTGEKLNDHLVYIDNKEYYYSNEDTNISEFRLDFIKKQSYDIRVIKSTYIESDFTLTAPLHCKDTVIIVKLLYRFQASQLPIFFFNKNDLYPDTNNLKYNMAATDYLSKTHKNKKLIIELNGYFYPDEDDTSNILVMKRMSYIKSLFINMGADSSMIEMILQKYKPYQIYHKEEINDYFRFKDILNQEYINNLPSDIRPIAERYNRRIIVTVKFDNN